MQEYRVGQILFLITNNKVIPVQVVEEVIRTTLRGKEKTYMVMFPDKEKTIVDIQKLKTEIFTSKESLRAFMLNNATKAIDEMISSADQVVIGFFSDNVNEDNVDNGKVISIKTFKKTESIIKEEMNKNTQKMQNSNNNNIITVDLGNGQVGKIKADDLET